MFFRPEMSDFKCQRPEEALLLLIGSPSPSSSAPSLGSVLFRRRRSGGERSREEGGGIGPADRREWRIKGKRSCQGKMRLIGRKV